MCAFLGCVYSLTMSRDYFHVVLTKHSTDHVELFARDLDERFLRMNIQYRYLDNLSISSGSESCEVGSIKSIRVFKSQVPIAELRTKEIARRDDIRRAALEEDPPRNIIEKRKANEIDALDSLADDQTNRWITGLPGSLSPWGKIKAFINPAQNHMNIK